MRWITELVAGLGSRNGMVSERLQYGTPLFSVAAPSRGGGGELEPGGLEGVNWERGGGERGGVGRGGGVNEVWRSIDIQMWCGWQLCRFFFCRRSGANICIFGSFDLTACLENERRISGVDRQGLFSAGVKQR